MTVERSYAPTNVCDELFSNEFGTSWVVKSERTPTAEAAIRVVTEYEGPPDDGWECRLRRARIEWREGEGWWLTTDDNGEYEVWEVDAA